MSATPAISVVIPAFNAEKFISETLRSVQAQTFRDFEVIVVDDGSTDATAEIIQGFCKNDPRIILVQQTNLGISAARNAGIKRSRAEWIAFLDSDDVWLPEKLATQVELSAKYPGANLLFTNFHAWDGRHDLHLGYPPDTNFPEGDVVHLLISQSLFLPSSVMTRAALIKDAGLFDTKLKNAEDWDLWLRMALRGLSARGSREPLMRYRYWPGSASSHKRIECLSHNVQVLETHLPAYVKKFPHLREQCHQSLETARDVRDILSAKSSAQELPALAKIVFSVWRRKRRFKWLRWYFGLKWPLWLGGGKIHDNIREKMATFTTSEMQKDEWFIACGRVSFVSIVIPVFNGEKYIIETLRSVQLQTFSNFEVIVVDDGSTDRTAELVSEFCKSDSRFRLIQQLNAGVSAARNTGIRNARADWVALLDGDDVWLPKKLDLQITSLRANPEANFAFTNFSIWDGERDLRTALGPDDVLPDGNAIEELITGSSFLPSTVMARKQLLIDSGLFDPRMKNGEDWDMWLRMVLHGLHVCGDAAPLVRYRRWPGSTTGRNMLLALAENVRLLERHLPGIVKKYPHLRRQCRHSLANAQTILELANVRMTTNGDDSPLCKAIWNAWRRERRLKWLRWYCFLKWPVPLGGKSLRRSIHKKIEARWPAPETISREIASTRQAA